MRIRWTNAAAADMLGISDYLTDHHPLYRQPTMRKLYERIRRLKNAPYLGRPGRESGTREIFFLPLPYVAISGFMKPLQKACASSTHLGIGLEWFWTAMR